MNVAEPIKNKTQLSEVMGVYPEGTKNHLLLAYCLLTGLRISDVLTAKVGDSTAGVWRGKEQKTGKTKTFILNTRLTRLINEYVSKNQLNDDDYLFFSSKNKAEPIKRNRADKIIRHAGDMIGITLSAHSLRKTFGYMAYKNGTDIALLMELFNHSKQSITLRYIGITQDNINAVYQSIDIGI